MRLDRWLVERGVESRAKAQELIREGKVLINGRAAKKPALQVGREDRIEWEAPRYVGRAAKKLEGLFRIYPVAVAGKRCLDVGASTGGFTQILLERGAKEVVALDVGEGQLHPSLLENGRVVDRSGTDLRDFYCDTPFDVVTCDVSFISLRHLLPHLDRLCDGVLVLLFKPQFEVGREAARNRQGVVTDEAAIAEAMDRFEKAAEGLGWRQMVKTPSILPGKEGNREWFYVYLNG